jgi:LCP family protein required for cell wall assembly
VRIEAARAGRARRRGLGVGAALLTGVLVVSAVALVAGLAFLLSPRGNGVAAGFLRAQPGSLAWNGSSQIDMLVMTRLTTGAPADSALVVSFNPNGDQLRLLSLPTNLWVNVPGYSQTTLGRALSDGGPSTALETVESVTHTVIPYYWIVDHATFARWVDSFDGVTVTANEPLGLGTNGKPLIPSGRHHLDGDRAVAFMTLRGAYDSGDGSTLLARQQALVEALIHHDFNAANIVKLPATLGSLGGDITTNFPFDRMPDVSRRLGALRTGNVASAIVGPPTGSATPYTTGGQTVLIPDVHRISTLALQLYGSAIPRSRTPVAVLNGSGVVGQATGLGAWLSAARMSVQSVGSARSYTFSHTRVYLLPSANAAAHRAARQIATLLRIPVESHTVAGSHAPVTVVIGQDYQDPTQQ